MTQTNFQSVSQINEIAGKTAHSSKGWVSADQQLKIIAGEYDEVVEAVVERNIDKLRDGIADLLVTAYGMGSVLGFDVDKDMKAVTDSLYTRFDISGEDAAKTQQKYLDVGVATDVITTVIGDKRYYATISAIDQTNCKTGEFLPRGKFLKSYKYKQPEMPAIDSKVADQLSNPMQESSDDMAVYFTLHKAGCPSVV